MPHVCWNAGALFGVKCNNFHYFISFFITGLNSLTIISISSVRLKLTLTNKVQTGNIAEV